MPPELYDPTVDESQLEEALFQASLKELRAPKPPQTGSLVFIGLFLFFLIGEMREMKSLSGIVVLVLVLLFHELGHAIGMRLFGFRDVRMFFIPFFGAAATGRPRGVASWKEAMVSLLGPLPGLLVALGGVFAIFRYPHPLLVTAVEILLFLNLFNLLPFGALDGGRFFQRVLFSRHRVLEVTFLAVGTALLGWLALKSSSFALLFFSAFGLIALPARWRILSLAAELRRQLPSLSPDPNQLQEVEARALFHGARVAVKGPPRNQPAALANTMEALLDAVKRPPGILASLGLVLLYALGCGAGLVGLLLMAMQNQPVDWHPVKEPGWHADFPRAPARVDEAGEVHFRAIVHTTERFTISLSDGAADEAWMNATRDRLAANAHLHFVSARPVEIGALPARELTLEGPGRVMRAILVGSGGHRYEVVASAPEWGDTQRRFFSSFGVTQ